jgi:hypothetical protein
VCWVGEVSFAEVVEVDWEKVGGSEGRGVNDWSCRGGVDVYAGRVIGAGTVAAAEALHLTKSIERGRESGVVEGDVHAYWCGRNVADLAKVGSRMVATDTGDGYGALQRVGVVDELGVVDDVVRAGVVPETVRGVVAVIAVGKESERWGRQVR